MARSQSSLRGGVHNVADEGEEGGDIVAEEAELAVVVEEAVVEFVEDVGEMEDMRYKCNECDKFYQHKSSLKRIKIIYSNVAQVLNDHIQGSSIRGCSLFGRGYSLLNPVDSDHGACEI